MKKETKDELKLGTVMIIGMIELVFVLWGLGGADVPIHISVHVIGLALCVRYLFLGKGGET